MMIEVLHEEKDHALFLVFPPSARTVFPPGRRGRKYHKPVHDLNPARIPMAIQFDLADAANLFRQVWLPFC
jgi:hypothetical protein